MKILGEVTIDDAKKHLETMDLNDKSLYKELCKSTFGIFQFSGGTAARMTEQVMPENMDDVVSLNSISRPGASFQLNDFIDAKNNPKLKKYPDIINDICKDSHGLILFQEQIMRAVETLSEKEIDGNYCRSLLKKLGKANKKQEDIDKWSKLVATVKKHAPKFNLTNTEVDMICNDMLTLAAYSFNKAHAYGYSYVAMETVYLTEYFRPYFYAANLTNENSKTDADDLKQAIRVVRNKGYNISQPDVNRSAKDFFPDVNSNSIRFGLVNIKGVGDAPYNFIMQHRPYNSLKDFVIRTSETGSKVTSKVVESLIMAGALDSIIGGEVNRKRALAQYNDFHDNKKTKKNLEILGELWDEREKILPDPGDTSIQEIIEMEGKTLGSHYFHGIFSEAITKKIEQLVATGKCVRNFDELRELDTKTRYVPVEIKSYQYKTQKNGEEMCFLIIEDANGEEERVPVFSSYWNVVKTKFFAEGFYLLSLYSGFNDFQGKECIMFGSKSFVKKDSTKAAMMIRWNIQ